jgi:hypothetical protein
MALALRGPPHHQTLLGLVGHRFNFQKQEHSLENQHGREVAVV